MANRSKQVCLRTSSDKRQLTATPHVSRRAEIVCMQCIITRKAARSHANIPAGCLLHEAVYEDHSEKMVHTAATFEHLLRKLPDKANRIRD